MLRGRTGNTHISVPLSSDAGLLVELGALEPTTFDDSALRVTVTPLGRQMASIPAHPRLAAALARAHDAPTAAARSQRPYTDIFQRERRHCGSARPVFFFTHTVAYLSLAWIYTRSLSWSPHTRMSETLDLLSAYDRTPRVVCVRRRRWRRRCSAQRTRRGPWSPTSRAAVRRCSRRRRRRPRARPLTRRRSARQLSSRGAPASTSTRATRVRSRARSAKRPRARNDRRRTIDTTDRQTDRRTDVDDRQTDRRPPKTRALL